MRRTDFSLVMALDIRLAYNLRPFRKLQRNPIPMNSTMSNTTTATPVNSPARVVFASLIGTTIEFYDFYVYATAAVLVFPHLFFPSSNETTALLASFAVFGAAMIARPLGAVFLVIWAIGSGARRRWFMRC